MPDWWDAAWKWIEALSGGAPQFLGALTGSLFGLLGILAGALYNARLNRKRDDTLRREEARVVIAAIRAELSSVKSGLDRNAKELEKGNPNDFYVPDISRYIRLLPELTQKIGLLGEDATSEIMRAFLLIDEYAGKLVMMGGAVTEMLQSRTFILLPSDKARLVASLNKVTAEAIQDAIDEMAAASANLHI